MNWQEPKAHAPATTAILARACASTDRGFAQARRCLASAYAARRLFEAGASAASLKEMGYAREAALAGARALRAAARAIGRAKESAR